jgi:hypothetical protein
MEQTDQLTPGEKCAFRLIWVAVAGATLTAIVVAYYLQGRL